MNPWASREIPAGRRTRTGTASSRCRAAWVAAGARFLTQSMFTGAGAVLANLSLFILEKVSPLEETAGNGVPYWMYVCFMIGTVCILVTVLTAMAAPRS